MGIIALGLLLTAPAGASVTMGPEVVPTGGDPQAPPATITLPLPATTMPDTWERTFVIGYGEADDELGTGLIGDGEGILVGPNSGAQGPDGAWWFIDTYKTRFANYSPSGDFLGDVPLAPEHLVDGQYFPHGGPRVLDDGSFVATNLGLTSTTTEVLRIREGVIDVLSLPTETLFRTDDGQRLYGFAWAGDTMIEADLTTGSVEETDWFRTRRGDRYRITLGDSDLRVRLPDADPPVDRTWAIASEAGAPLLTAIQVASGVDGTLHLLMTGFEDVPGSADLVAYTTISADGTLGDVEAVLTPFESTDPGGPWHLGVHPGGVMPWLVYVRADGVHVYQRHP